MVNYCYLPVGGLLQLSGLVSANELRPVLGSKFLSEKKVIGESFVEKRVLSRVELNHTLSLQFLVGPLLVNLGIVDY